MHECRRCGGYGGWWSHELGDGVGWEVRPEDEDDGVGYVICGCNSVPDRVEYLITLIKPPWWKRAWRWTGLDVVGVLIVGFLTLVPALALSQPYFFFVFALVTAAQIFENRRDQ